MNKNRPTLQDIATRTGVSTATVCRILNENINAKVNTRQRVKRVAEELGYHYKTNLFPPDSKLLIVIGELHCIEYQHEIIKGLQQQAEQQGYQLLVLTASTNSKNLFHYITQHPVSGAIFLNHRDKLKLLQQQVAQSIPTVLVNSISNKSNITAIHLDYLTAAYQAICYLQKLGHRYIASIGGYKELITTQHIEQGYQLALQRQNIAPNKHFMINCNMSAESAVNALEQLLNLPHQPSALFCHNDELALGILFQAKTRGLSIPKDLSVMSLSDSKLARYLNPSLTCIKNPLFEQGEQAARFLISYLKEPAKIHLPRLVEGKLIIGHSTGEYY